MKDSLHLNTKLLGLIGHPVKQTLSPFIHNVAIDLAKIDYIYLPFDILSSSLKDAVKGMVALGIKGFNVTIPHKVKILDLMHNLSEEAATIGAVNTVVNNEGKLSGYNTDVNGIQETLNPYKDKITGSTISIIGAGGGARAVIYTLIRHFKPEKIYIINRTEQRADTLKEFFSTKMRYDEIVTKEYYPPDDVEILSESGLIVNATPVGMNSIDDDTITPVAESIHKDQVVFDLVYNPAKTNLLYLAEKQGAIAVNGMKMLVHQAAKSFELWTGEKMQTEKVFESLNLYLNS